MSPNAGSTSIEDCIVVPLLLGRRIDLNDPKALEALGLLDAIATAGKLCADFPQSVPIEAIYDAMLDSGAGRA